MQGFLEMQVSSCRSSGGRQFSWTQCWQWYRSQHPLARNFCLTDESFDNITVESIKRWEYNMSVDRADIRRKSDVSVNERWAEKGMDNISIACRSSCGRRSRPPSRRVWSCLSVCCRSAISTKSVKLSHQYIISVGLLICSKF